MLKLKQGFWLNFRVVYSHEVPRQGVVYEVEGPVAAQQRPGRPRHAQPRPQPQPRLPARPHHRRHAAVPSVMVRWGTQDTTTTLNKYTILRLLIIAQIFLITSYYYARLPGGEADHGAWSQHLPAQLGVSIHSLGSRYKLSVLLRILSILCNSCCRSDWVFAVQYYGSGEN